MRCYGVTGGRRPRTRHRGGAARGGLRRHCAFAERRLRDLADAGERAQHGGCFHRQHDDLLVRRIGKAAERLDVFVGDEVVQRRDVALGDRLRHHRRRLGLGLGRTLAGLGVAESGLAAAFGLQDLALLGALGAQDFRLPLAFRLKNVCALDTFGFHLPAHRLDEVGRRHDVLDLDAVDLQSPRRHRGVDHAQETLVDLVAMRQHLVEIHRTHHREDVGHGQHRDRLREIGDLVARLRRIEDLEEGNAVDGHRGIVLGDHLLFGNVDHLLHHVDLAPDAVEKRHDQVKARRQGVGVLAEPLDGPVPALRHGFHAGEQRDDDEQNKHNCKDVKAGHSSSWCPLSEVRDPAAAPTLSRTSESNGHQQLFDSSVAIDLKSLTQVCSTRCRDFKSSDTSRGSARAKFIAKRISRFAASLCRQRMVRRFIRHLLAQIAMYGFHGSPDASCC
jgi:hypothetical protein